MSEPNTVQNVEGLSRPVETDSVDRVDDLTESWESSPLTDPAGAQDPEAKPIEDHGDTDESGSGENRTGF